MQDATGMGASTNPLGPLVGRYINRFNGRPPAACVCLTVRAAGRDVATQHRSSPEPHLTIDHEHDGVYAWYIHRIRGGDLFFSRNIETLFDV